MKYNIDFLIASLIFLAVMIVHVAREKHVKNRNNSLFGLLLIFGVLDILLDIVTSITISWENPIYNNINMWLNTAFYIAQIAVPYLLFCYTAILQDKNFESIKKKCLVVLIIPILMLIVVLVNIGVPLLFEFTTTGAYLHGKWYLSMYLYAMALGALVVIDAYLNHQYLSKKKKAVIVEYVCIVFSCVIFQALSNDILTTGLGIGLGLMILILTINNPYTNIDNVTGILNQTSLYENINKRISKSKPYYIIAIDVIRLKEVNNTLGMSVGDRCLIHFIDNLEKFGINYEIYRVSGKRFVIVLDTLYEYKAMLDQCKYLFSNDFSISNYIIDFPAEICGITETENIKDSDSLMAYIEYLSVLNNKSLETNIIQGDIHTQIGYEENLMIEKYVKEALNKDLLEVHFQPVFDINTKKIVSAEALSRLYHPTLGNVRPDIFINICQKNGWMEQFSLLQFEKVCKYMDGNRILLKQLKNVKFNLSPTNLLAKEFSKHVFEIIGKYNLPTEFFQFEVTETVATKYSRDAFDLIEAFNKKNIHLALDDFGSGYANLNNVMKLPFACIKLDRSLLDGICSDQQRASFYEGLVQIFKKLKYDLIAEGVETEDEYNLLKEWGVDYIQGYYFSKPLPILELVKLIEENNTEKSGL